MALMHYKVSPADDRLDAYNISGIQNDFPLPKIEPQDKVIEAQDSSGETAEDTVVTDSKSNDPKKSLKWILISFAVAVALIGSWIAGIVLAILLAECKKMEPIEQWTSTYSTMEGQQTTGVPSNTAVDPNSLDLLALTLKLNRTFDDKLLDPKSLEFNVLQKTFCSQVSLLYNNSALAQDFFGCIVNSFAPGSIIVNFTIITSKEIRSELLTPPDGSNVTSKDYTVFKLLEDNRGYAVTDAEPGSASIREPEESLNKTAILKVVLSPDIDWCKEQPCLHGGICVDGIEEFYCLCPEGYQGKVCEEDTLDCLNNTCNSHGECLELVGGGYACRCDLYHTGFDCSSEISTCSNMTCYFHGHCLTLLDGGFTCVCEAGYTGGNCSQALESCQVDSCNGHGSCLSLAEGGFVCLCDAGFTSENCNSSIEGCSNSSCSNHGTCLELSDGRLFCVCDEGFTSENCSIEVEGCSNSSCSGHGQCISAAEGIKCICDTGFTSENCSIDIDECSSNPCGSYGNCTDDIASFTCKCDSGYKGSTCSVKTIDCSTSPCLNGGECNETSDGFSCMCAAGYTGTTCGTEIDECTTQNVSNPCGANGTCIDLIDGFICKCDDNYFRKNCSRLNLPCRNVPALCSFKGRCIQCDDMCSNGLNYYCNCTAGYTGMHCEFRVVDGGWSAWIPTTSSKVDTFNEAALGTCSLTTSNQVRTCSNPLPAYGGKPCTGNSTRTAVETSCMCTSCPEDPGDEYRIPDSGGCLCSQSCTTNCCSNCNS